MSDVLTRVSSVADGLAAAEARVARYVRGHSRKVPYQSIGVVARSARVSVASVSRLARRLGYASYREFKIGLAQELLSPVSVIYDVTCADDTDAEVVRKIFGGNVQSLQNTLKMLSVSDCARRSCTAA